MSVLQLARARAGNARVAIGFLAAFVVAPEALAFPLISEVFYDAVGSDDGQTFVELYGDPGTPLDELQLEVVNGSDGAVVLTLTLSGTIPGDGIFVVGDRDAEGASQVGDADLLLNFDIQNGPDSLILRDAMGVLDALGFGAFSGGEVFAGEGNPADDAPAGASLARHFADLDTDDNAADFGVLESPTPGSAPVSAVPEPSAGALATLGILGLALLGNRIRGCGDRPV